MLSPLAITILRGDRILRKKIADYLGQTNSASILYLIKKNTPMGTLCRPDVLRMIEDKTGIEMERLYISQSKETPTAETPAA